MKRIPGPARAGVRLAALWLLIEFLIRDGIGELGEIVIVWINPRLHGSSDYLPGPLFTLLVVLSITALGAEFLVFRRYRRLVESAREFRGYLLSRRSLTIGVVAGAFRLAAAGYVTGPADRWLFGEMPPLTPGIVEAGWVTAVLLIIGNVLMAPFVEEFAWRGIVQPRFQRAWGFWWGVMLTTLLFAGKHFVVDLSLRRTTTLLVGAFGLSYVGAKWGLAASTTMHFVANGTGTILMIMMAF